ncbi:MAG TPA: hypothetical protein VI122_19260, partial [Thermoleophilaceae bacterium]
AESSAAYNYGELQPNGDLYFSVTIPSLIVATYGGGTGLATERECLELIGLLRQGQGPEARRDHRRHRAVRRSSRSARPSWRRSGSRPTICSGEIAPNYLTMRAARLNERRPKPST